MIVKVGDDRAPKLASAESGIAEDDGDQFGNWRARLFARQPSED